MHVEVFSFSPESISDSVMKVDKVDLVQVEVCSFSPQSISDSVVKVDNEVAVRVEKGINFHLKVSPILS